MEDKKNRKIEIIASAVLAVVALVWGTTYAVIKDTLSTVQPFSLMMMRFGFSAILLVLVYLKKFREIKKIDIKRGGIIGAFMFLAFYFLIISIRFTTASKFSFIIGAYVLIVPFLVKYACPIEVIVFLLTQTLYWTGYEAILRQALALGCAVSTPVIVMSLFMDYCVQKKQSAFKNIGW